MKLALNAIYSIAVDVYTESTKWLNGYIYRCQAHSLAAGIGSMGRL
ncbi:hypothetical protein [Polaromonas sp. CG9_12]|nr:hypothetical protein [Polaromonas sp. CG9_12]